MKTIRLSDNKIVLHFDFDPQIVISVRKIDGRIWNAPKKRWEVPMENVKEVLDTLIPIGFVPDATVTQLLDKQNRFLEEIESLKREENIKYTGSLPLHNFQRVGYSFLKSMPHALLGDVPGLGKSIQVIACLEDTPGPHLVICPNSLKYNWRDEILKWEPKSKVIVIDGDKSLRRTQWFYGKKDAKYVIANYEILRIDIEEIQG